MGSPLICAEIDLEAIAHNVRELRKITHPEASLMAVVKANAYGHGSREVARQALHNGAQMLGVARIDEAIDLRKAGFDVPILILGYSPSEMAEFLIRYDLTQTVFSLENARKLSGQAVSAGNNIRIHIKMDTGMGRLGLITRCSEPSLSRTDVIRDALEEVTRIIELPGLIPEGIMTHFATADSKDKTVTLRQFQIFNDLIRELSLKNIRFPIRHAANSAALIDLPETHLDMVRPGISLYGLYPSEEINRSKIMLKPAMSLRTKIIHLKKVPRGFYVSYGQTYQTSRTSTIATVPIGYADGFNRQLSSKGYMLVHEKRAPIVGRVCMDLTMLDVSHIPRVAVEDEVVVFGTQGPESISVDEIAGILNTIHYEIVAAITARVPRVYRRVKI